MITLGARQLSIGLVEEIIKGLTTEVKPITMEEIIEKVCMQYNIKPELLEAKTRKHEIVLARHMSMFFIRKYVKIPLKAIGSRFGGRDHATVIHACSVIENYLQTNKKIKEEYEILDTIICNR
jgi:chromosomal replication initiator protein